MMGLTSSILVVSPSYYLHHLISPMSCRNMADCLDQEELDNSKVSTILDMFSSVRLSLSTLREIEKRGGERRQYVLTGRKSRSNPGVEDLTFENLDSFFK